MPTNYSSRYYSNFHNDSRLYGYFYCECGAKWESAWTWVDYYQNCKECGAEVYARKTERLKSIRWAIFNCYCGNEWTDFIDATYNEQYNYYGYDNGNEEGYDNYYEDYECYDNYYDENQEGYDNYYEDGEGYEIRYDLDPQRCYCGQWVYPSVSYKESDESHRDDLCQKCQIEGSCYKNY